MSTCLQPFNNFVDPILRIPAFVKIRLRVPIQQWISKVSDYSLKLVPHEKTCTQYTFRCVARQDAKINETDTTSRQVTNPQIFWIVCALKLHNLNYRERNTFSQLPAKLEHSLLQNTETSCIWTTAVYCYLKKSKQ